jgi:hypothetical protein
MEPGLIVIVRSTITGKDALGRPTVTTTRSAPVNGLLRATGTVEGEAFVVDEYVATLPLGTDLRAADKVEARGLVYTVQGSPFATTIPRTSIGVLTARLKYVGPVTP